VDAAPQLVTDFNAYNARVNRRHMIGDQFGRSTLRADPTKLGMHWVGDLTLEADVDIESAGGALLVDLVEGGVHFTCTVDLATGKATLAIDGQTDFAPTAATPLQGTGRHRVALANVDDQLLLWVDDKLVAFDGPTTYDADTVFGDRRQLRPRSTSSDPGDLSPAGIAASGAQVAIDRLRLYRDIYYIATDWRQPKSTAISDMSRFNAPDLDTFLSDPQYWDAYLERGQVEFPLTDDQFFVMGDNSPESLDARLWRGEDAQQHGGRPGGSYLERELLIGKALCVYWPHSWYHIPGTPIPVFPNFADMRLVR
jgi:signal peptidase I